MSSQLDKPGVTCMFITIPAKNVSPSFHQHANVCLHKTLTSDDYVETKIYSLNKTYWQH